MSISFLSSSSPDQDPFQVHFWSIKLGVGTLDSFFRFRTKDSSFGYFGLRFVNLRKNSRFLMRIFEEGIIGCLKTYLSVIKQDEVFIGSDCMTLI